MSGVVHRYGKRENLTPMTTLFFARLGNTMKEQTLKEICEKYGTVDEVTMVCDRETKKPKGCAFVKFSTTIDAENCLLQYQKEFWIVEWAKSTQIRDSDLDKKTIYVTGIINENAEETIVYDHFCVYGTIEKVTVVDANFPPYAFIKFTEEKFAQQALKNENGKCWDGTSLVVQFSETLESKKSRRLHKTKTSSYSEIKEIFNKKQSLIDCFFDESSNSLIQTLLYTFSFWSNDNYNDYNQKINSDNGYDVLINTLSKDIKKVDSPLLKNYEKLIHQLDDEDDLIKLSNNNNINTCNINTCNINTCNINNNFYNNTCNNKIIDNNYYNINTINNNTRNNINTINNNNISNNNTYNNTHLFNNKVNDKYYNNTSNNIENTTYCVYNDEEVWKPFQ